MSNTSTTSAYVVPNGPFSGVTALPGEIVINTDDYNGREYSNWEVHARTRHFLTVFNPLEGWRVVLQQAPLGLLLPDYSLTRDGNASVPENPAWLFTATLRDKDNNDVANASVVQIFNCAMSIEIGQTRARGKLYQALGLPSSPSCEEEPRQPAARPAVPHAPKVIPVVDVTTPAAMPAPQAPVAVTADPQAAASNDSTDSPSDAAPSPEDVVDKPEANVSEVDVAQMETSAEGAQEAAEHEVDSHPELDSVTVVPATAPSINAGKLSPAAVKAQAKAATTIPTGVMRQIEIRAKKAGVEIPELHTVDQATAFLAQLINPSTACDLASGG